MHVLVLGAGVIGVASAWYLSKAGHEVTLVDRHDAAGLETSLANGGQISVSHAQPWANPRHEHEWRVWEKAKLPRGKTLVPGVISHATNIVEHPELVAERLVRIGKLIGRENLMAGTDCGFAQGPFHRRVHPTIMWAKLEALAAGARLASRELS